MRAEKKKEAIEKCIKDLEPRIVEAWKLLNTTHNRMLFSALQSMENGFFEVKGQLKEHGYK